MRISLNVIVYNEEARLEECLLDARPHVDEIVVVDQMSTDRTPEIAQRLADVFIRDVHHGHAEPSRELAASRSTGDWILVLDADELMSDLLKDRIRDLIEGDPDGYWIRKTNLVDGVEASTVLHLRLVRASRAVFDPRPHGGAGVITGNVATFDEIGIIHAKTEAEQLYDDARYEQMAAEEQSPSSDKRNWLQHNVTLRAHREAARRSDLEGLLPADASSVLVVGGLAVDWSDRDVVRVERFAAAPQGPFDAAVVALGDDDRTATLASLAAAVRPGGVIVGTATTARNLRRLEEIVGALYGEGSSPELRTSAGSTRRTLLDELDAAGLDAQWMRLVRDGWLDQVPLRADGAGVVIESPDFFLKNVPAEVAEELTSTEIVFVARRPQEQPSPLCSIVLAPFQEADAETFAEALRATAPDTGYELIVVPADDPRTGLATRWNTGARQATGELLVFVAGAPRPDIGWLDGLVESLRSRRDAGAIGSKVVALDGTVEHAGVVIGSDTIPFRSSQGEPEDAASVSRTRIVPTVAADGMLTNRATFVEVGGFDETLAEELADADYGLRLRSRGLTNVYSAACVLRSQVRTTSASRMWFRRSVREFSSRWTKAAGSHVHLAVADGLEPSREWNRSWRLPRPSAPATSGLPAVAWSSHFYEQGGYTEEAITIVEALDDAGIHVVANPITYDRKWSPMPSEKAERLASLVDRDLPDGFVHVAHIGANRFKRHPDAVLNVGRTMFETDGLPAEWRDLCNTMDEIWVPCQHNVHSFASGGVDPSKLHVVPETYDAELFRPDVAPLAIDGLDDDAGFVFLSVFSWLGRKGWDVLLRAYFEEFRSRDDVTLLLKTDTNLAPGTNCTLEVQNFVRHQLGINPKKGPRVVVLDRPMDTANMPGLYRAADAFVLASHGEGWGRPYMEAMVMGLPTIATRWSGNLEFMDDQNSLLIDFELVDSLDDDWHRGQRWADPSVKDLRRAMRQLADHPDEAAELGARARADVQVSCSPRRVADTVRARLEAVDRHPVHVAVPTVAVPTVVAAASPMAPQVDATAGFRPADDGRRITACVVVRDGGSSLRECLASLHGAVDDITVIETDRDDDMSTIRNAALDRVTGGWVLMLDSSQTLDPASRSIVRDLARIGGFVGHTAREVRQLGYDGAISSIERRVPVLFPKHPGLRYLGPVNEQLLSTDPRLEFALRSSGIVVHQHDRSPERTDPSVVARRHLSALERTAKEFGDEPFHQANLGHALQLTGLHAEAEEVLRAALDAAPPRASWAPAAMVALARSVTNQGRAAEAVKICKRATKLAPDWAAGWCALGAARVDTGRPEKALEAYHRALDAADRSVGATGCSDDTAWLVRTAIAKIHFARDDHHEAAAHLAGALAIRPGDEEMRVMLARAYAALGYATQSRRELETALTVRAGADPYLRFSDHFTEMAHNALLRGVADNPEHPALLHRIEAMRAAGLVD